MAGFGGGPGCEVTIGAGAERMVGIGPGPGRSAEMNNYLDEQMGLVQYPDKLMVWKQELNEHARLETDPVEWMGLEHHSLVTLDSDKQIE